MPQMDLEKAKAFQNSFRKAMGTEDEEDGQTPKEKIKEGVKKASDVIFSKVGKASELLFGK